MSFTTKCHILSSYQWQTILRKYTTHWVVQMLERENRKKENWVGKRNVGTDKVRFSQIFKNSRYKFTSSLCGTGAGAGGGIKKATITFARASCGNCNLKCESSRYLIIRIWKLFSNSFHTYTLSVCMRRHEQERLRLYMVALWKQMMDSNLNDTQLR